MPKYLKIELPISNLKLKELQEQDKKINHLRKLWSENKLNKNIFAMENDILKKKVIECGLLYKPVIIPEILRECLLILAHDEQGHNGFKENTQCFENPILLERHEETHTTLLQKMQDMCTTQCSNPGTSKGTLLSNHHNQWNSIAMDLIGEFHPASSKGNRYALTAICMLTGFTFLYTAKIQESRGRGNGLI